MAKKMKIIEAKEPKSLCFCGHLGDGPNSSHAGPIGHGVCTVIGCRCQKFIWAKFTRYGQELMLRLRTAQIEEG